jgi:hypothetical protein
MLVLGLPDPDGLFCQVFAMVGAVAQLGEHLLCKQGVSGSIPLSSTNSLPKGDDGVERVMYPLKKIQVCTTRIALVPVLQKS